MILSSDINIEDVQRLFESSSYNGFCDDGSLEQIIFETSQEELDKGCFIHNRYKGKFIWNGHNKFQSAEEHYLCEKYKLIKEYYLHKHLSQTDKDGAIALILLGLFVVSLPILLKNIQTGQTLNSIVCTIIEIILFCAFTFFICKDMKYIQ